MQGQEAIRAVMHQMIDVNEAELDGFLENCLVQKFPAKSFLSRAGQIPNEIFFINKGILRVLCLGADGTEHSIHFALENQFIADYSHFLQKQAAQYSLQALEDLEVIILPRRQIEWGYANLREGQRMGRLIAEYYFIYQDNRINNQYLWTPKQRYDQLNQVFPGIHQRVPQHMIASYLGISSVHLSRLKKADL